MKDGGFAGAGQSILLFRTFLILASFILGGFILATMSQDVKASLVMLYQDATGKSLLTRK